MNRKKTSLAEALAKHNFDDGALVIKPEVKLASDLTPFETKKKDIVDRIVSAFKSGTEKDLNKAVKAAVEEHGLNREEGNRIIQSVNTAVYQYVYDQTSGIENRKVNFEIAAPEKVFSDGEPSAEPAVVDENNEKVASHKMTLLEKLASLEDQEFEFHSPALDPLAKEAFLAERIANDIEKTEKELTKVSSERASDLAMIGYAFSEYAKTASLDVQDVFEKMAVQSKMRKTQQADVIIAYNRARSIDKRASSTELQLVDIDAVKDFSLGKHSISKIAEQNILSLPEVSDKKKDVKDFQKLVELALKIQSDEQLEQNLVEKLNAKKALVENAVPVVQQQ